MLLDRKLYIYKCHLGKAGLSSTTLTLQKTGKGLKGIELTDEKIKPVTSHLLEKMITTENDNTSTNWCHLVDVESAACHMCTAAQLRLSA